MLPFDRYLWKEIKAQRLISIHLFDVHPAEYLKIVYINKNTRSYMLAHKVIHT